MDATSKIKSVSPTEPIASCVNANKSNYILLAKGIMASYPKAFYLNPKQLAPSKIQIECDVTKFRQLHLSGIAAKRFNTRGYQNSPISTVQIFVQ